MTSDTYKKIMSILTDQEIYNFAERLCTHFKFDPFKQYSQCADSEILSGAAKRMLYLHRAANLLRRAIFLGGTELEIYRISQYLVVIKNAIDHKLDYRRCEKEMDISGLSKKYNESDFLSLDFDERTIENVLKRDNDYYEVKIKDENS